MPPEEDEEVEEENSAKTFAFGRKSFGATNNNNDDNEDTNLDNIVFSDLNVNLDFPTPEEEEENTFDVVPSLGMINSLEDL